MSLRLPVALQAHHHTIQQLFVCLHDESGDASLRRPSMANREMGLCRGAAWLAFAALGCAPRAAAPATVEVRPAEGAPAPTPTATLPAPTDAEREPAGRLQQPVHPLSVEIGDRHAVNAGPAYAATDKMGSFIYATALKAEGLDVRAMLCLDGLGAFAPGPPVRPYPAEVRPPYPPRSDFMALVGNEDSRSLLEQLARS